jgi:hypothetical protein
MDKKLILFLAASLFANATLYSKNPENIGARSEIVQQLKSIEKANYVFRPDYEKTLERVLVTFTGDDAAVIGIIKKLPAYSKITAFYQSSKEWELGGKKFSAPFWSVKEVKNSLSPFLARDMIEKIEFIDANPSDTVGEYTQNIGKGDKDCFFVPFTQYEYGDVYSRNNLFVDRLGGKVKVERHPAAITGGNIYLAKNKNNEKIIFVGKGIIDKTEEIYKNLKINYSTKDIEKLMRDSFRVDKEVTIENNEYMFHIDQLFVPLDDGLAAMLMTENSGYKEYLSNAKKILEKNGFEVIGLYTDKEHIEKYMSYANMEVYRNKMTGEKTILMPVFPGKKGIYSNDGLNRKNREILEKRGFKVITIHDRGYEGHGNTHCLINALE